ncbi:lipopolysaccharide biosynthesis protein [Paenibacillus sp. LjRoot56]|uniref:lipopolysaccharide biosynthesis protein n=1 Tax=Paenibacillus sp. LjRoot56 TaxID=3342333 RepID=UPI003ED0FEC2
MRSINSIINISTGLGSQIIINLLSFFSRTVFIGALGVQYLGINGLFTNVLGMLSLAEAGIGASIIYALYAPVAEKNYDKISSLMKMYRNAFRVIATVIFILGLSLMPFLKYFVKNTNLDNLHLIFFLFLISTVSTYFFSYKISLLNVNQKGYISTAVYTISSVLSTLIKIGILTYTKNYILYLIIDILITLITSIILSLIVNKMYPFLKNKVTSKLDGETKKGIIKNMKALVLHQIGSYAVFGTDSIIISSFVSVAAVGLYSNYYMLINICRTFINQIFDNVVHSLGNLVVEESKSKVHNVFKTTMFMNFWIYSFFTIFLYIIIEPFVIIWLGKDFLMARSVLIIVMINFYVTGMRRSINMVKQTFGIFHEDRYAPLIEAAINLGVSLILVQYMGIAGVFIATLISTLVIPFWIAPYLVYKKAFNQPLREYYFIYVFYAAIGFGVLMITEFVSSQIETNSIVSLCLRGLIALVIPNLAYILIFYKTEHFKYLIGIVEQLKIRLVGIKRRKISESI